MAELNLMKTTGGALIPLDPNTEETLKKIGTGSVLNGEFKKLRNPKFHRKVFALFNLGYEIWDAPELEYKGVQVQKNFDKFRNDITVIAGYFDAVPNMMGELQLVAKSISFGNMDDIEFEKLYKKVRDVIWTRILSSKGYDNPEAVDEIVNKLLEFDR